MQETHDAYAALRHRDYRHVLGASVLASMGTEMQSVAVGWELYERTGAAEDLGLVGLALFLPVITFALPAGHVADRFSRKWVLVIANSVMTCVSLGLAALSFYRGPIALMYVCLFIAGTCRAFGGPARGALIPQIVPLESLGNAIAWNSSGWQVASASGPAVGGLLLALVGQGWGVYLTTACCLAACTGLIVTIHPHAPVRIREPISLRSLLDGVRFVWRTKVILATITLDLFAVLFGGATALLPIYAKDILHVGATGLGLLRASPSLGALVMAVVMAHRPPLRRAGPTLLIAVAGFGVATMVFGLSQNMALSLAMLAVCGALDNISVVVRGTLVQTLTPDALRGRVAAVNTIFITSSNELGWVESGYMAKWFGPVFSVVSGGIGTLLVVVAVMLRWPQVLRLGSLHRIAIMSTPPPPPSDGRASHEDDAQPRGTPIA